VNPPTPSSLHSIRSAAIATWPLLITGLGLVASHADTVAPDRVTRHLQVLYEFQSTTDQVVRDRSGVKPPIDLHIADPAAVRRRNDSLALVRPTRLRSGPESSRLSDAVGRSGEITLEAWITTSKLGQDGPARILSLSRNPSQRNFTLGQDGSRWVVRLRTSKSSRNGLPSLETRAKTVRPRLTHVVYTRRRDGTARFFLDGRPAQSATRPGHLHNWDSSDRLLLGNEATGDRPWLGTYHLVAIYDRALSPGEVLRNFRAGSSPTGAADPAPAPTDRGAKLFATRIAPLLARRCLDCHDSATREGGIDLSQRETAFAAKRGGAPIVPGDPGRSRVWESISADEMPEDGDALTPEEKKLLHDWIARGAPWPFAEIDPADFLHGVQPPAAFAPRLTRKQYVETLGRLLDVDVAAEAKDLLPPDVRADGFHNTAYHLTVDFGHVDAYARLAEVVAQRVDVRSFLQRFPGTRKISDDDGMEELIADIGLRILRGPLTRHEVLAFRGLTTTVSSAGGDFQEAIRYVLEAMLQSPRFLYRIERQDAEGNPLPPSGYGLISRLSYVLWGGPPDDELFEAASKGRLYGKELEAQVQRMLQDPRARMQSLVFLADWLHLDRLDHLQPSHELFPHWDPALAAAMRAETVAFFEEIVWEQQRPLSDLFNAQLTFAPPALARHYGLPPGDSAAESTRYNLREVPARGGLLTQASVLTMGGDEASMVTRGLFVLQDLLRGVIKAPPPGLDTTPVPPSPGQSHRAIAETRIADRQCGGCHGKFEPLAFGLEKFDGIGSYHEVDRHGNRLREDGEVLFPGEAEPVSYDSIAELMDLLAASERVRETLTWKLTQFALGRPTTAADAPVIDRIHQEGWKRGGTYSDLMQAIVLSDLVSPGYR